MKDMLFYLFYFIAGAIAHKCSSSDIYSCTIVHTQSGDLQGSILTTWTNKKFFSFRGIPFAEPPVGNLRFKAPISKKPWTGIKNATEDGNICPQLNSDSLGPADEDCLFLNVYSKNLQGNKPVIVYFHPGGFFIFTGASFWAGPQYLLDHDFVLVTVNYRLDALGFMSTGDKNAVGNFGMKDQVEALRWVQKNIKSFGGNPNEVTIAGYSAGSTSGFLHMLSPMSRGLFHRVIGMSSGITSGWLLQKDPKKTAIKFAKLFNCSTETTQRLVECLHKIPAKEVNNKFEEMTVFAGNPLQFTLVIEPDSGSGEERFLTDDPVSLIKRKQFYSVPIVTGINELELNWWGTQVMNTDSLREEFIKNFNSLAPIVFGYSWKKPTEAQRITDEFKKFYFGKKIAKNSSTELGKLFSDSAVVYGEYSTAKLFNKYSEKPVYFYKFTYKGRYGFISDPVTNETMIPSHLDELLYLFHVSKSFPLFKENDPDAFMVKILTSFWKKFATKGDPTPDGSPVPWTPLSKTGNITYLNFNKHLKMEDWSQSCLVERMNLWESLIPFD